MNDESQPVDGAIVAIDRIEARLTHWDWPFLAERRGEIEARWARLIVEKPSLFDGRVILQHQRRQYVDADGSHVFEALYFETSYSAFVACRELKPAGDKARNGFSAAALQSRDGAYLLGLMGPQTYIAGQVQFAAGTPDLSDVMADGMVDLESSVLRELEEETGLTRSEVTLGAQWHAVFAGEEIAFMRPMRINLDAEAAKALILQRVADQDQPEFADVVIVRDLCDIDEARMPRFMQLYLRHALKS
ncbi:MAG: NUDIX hydrolase [Beijerinckiaceae bacterium]|nr:NUDIX hydrolase [Beijerinckiaceae bacterium]